jgi:hypothetical protein
LTVSLILLVIWAISGMGYPWPLWAIGPWGAVLLGRTVMGLASGDPHGYAASRQAQEQSRRRDRRERRRYR